MPEASVAKTEAPKRFERLAPYLRPNQIDDMQREKRVIEGQLNAPPYLRRVLDDPKQAIDTLARIAKQLDADAPKEYKGADLDTAVKRERELREAWLAGMPTAAEMRKNPPGALEKHMAWERRHRENIDEWKNIRQRLYTSGALPSEFEGSSVSNIEVYRPVGGPNELSMDGAQIAGKQWNFGVGGAVDSVLFTPAQLAILKLLSPEIHDKIALLSADQRREVMAALPPEPTLPAEATDLTNVDFKELRERCRAAGLETGGTKEDLKARLAEFYAGTAEQAA